ncbi:hypothetical protein O6P43_027910 [Quillaja saponaria]|uniref:Uncharacterized protein n=1 Tax=Quillaja saponaria TaxID=32244 RepID=A0AAD7L5G4_QUISA|nr:hypothetical protein O6P43_027910 [Quillaja saponaria]KAJ7951936.1 hypothetical protein O6P43_027910 [Quillaja saponaria]
MEDLVGVDRASYQYLVESIHHIASQLISLPAGTNIFTNLEGIEKRFPFNEFNKVKELVEENPDCSEVGENDVYDSDPMDEDEDNEPEDHFDEDFDDDFDDDSDIYGDGGSDDDDDDDDDSDDTDTDDDDDDEDEEEDDEDEDEEMQSPPPPRRWKGNFVGWFK